MPGNELEVLSHYKRKIEKNPDNEEVLLRSLAKLDGVRVNIALLQDTGIGRTVSLLKKKYGDEEIGTKSRDLVTKWKEIVAREEEDDQDDATGDEEAPEVETNGHRSPPSYVPTPIAPAYVPTVKQSGYVPTPLSELKHESRDSENPTSDDPYENEIKEHNGTNGYGETEVTQTNGEDSDREHHRKSKKHKKDKDREKEKKDKNRYEEEKEKLKKKKSSHRDNSEEEIETKKIEIKSEYIKKETLSHSPPKKEKSDRDDRNDKDEKKDKHTHEEKKDKHSSRDDRKDKDKKDKHNKDRESKEKSREHKSSSSDHKSRHENSRSSSSKHSESKDRDREKERKSHKDKHRDRERTKDESDKKHSSSKSKDRPKSETEESHDRSEKQRLKDKKKKSENASMAGFDMFASMDGNSDKKHKKRPREDSTDETETHVKSEETYKPTSKQSRVDSSSDLDPPGSNGFTAVMDHKKFKLPTPPTMDPTSFSSGPSFIPDISPHYKPLPRAPPPPNNHNKVDEGVTLDALIASRGKRQMAVYSGAKRGCGFRGEVPSLKDQCIQKLQDNVDDIYECGGLSFDVLEPILNRASPETLMQIELYNPYLMEDTGPIWERFCKKEFRNKTRNADDFESWREMYERCIREREEKLLRLKDKVSKNFNARGEAKDSAARQTKMAFVDQVSKPPREVRVQQAKNGTALPVGHSFKPGAGNSKIGMRNSDPTSGSRSVMSSKKPKTAPMMAKVRRMMRR